MRSRARLIHWALVYGTPSRKPAMTSRGRFVRRRAVKLRFRIVAAAGAVLSPSGSFFSLHIRQSRRRRPDLRPRATADVADGRRLLLNRRVRAVRLREAAAFVNYRPIQVYVYGSPLRLKRKKARLFPAMERILVRRKQ